MQKKILLLVLPILNSLMALAQEPIVCANDSMAILENIQLNYDSLYVDWISRHHITMGDVDVATTTNEALTDSLIIERLQRIPTTLELPYNEDVHKYIEYYANRIPQKVSFMLGAYNFYAPIIEEALDRYDLPLELKYLPIVESGLNPKARSRMGAAGLWQFMMRTAKLYGMTSNTLVDERQDPVKSTDAAARMLGELYKIYQDWNLVLAAYNCGSGNVNKAIKRAGGKTDFWQIYARLPRETRGYVPAFIAATYIMNYYCNHGITPADCTLPAASDTIMIDRALHLEQVAQVCQIDLEQLRALNPQYRKDILPGQTKPCPLRIPSTKLSTFIELQDSVYAYKANELVAKRAIARIDRSVGGGTLTKGKDGGQYYKIRSGDTLGSIARRFRVTVRQIQKLNGMTDTRIHVGRSIRIK
ncbi:MAG: transglycosylase SLT domain-containing protein [Bacteroidales bacterium]|nr:transglycosylase SLT domain-containing protein [Bacteroidales bacterium]